MRRKASGRWFAVRLIALLAGLTVLVGTGTRVAMLAGSGERSLTVTASFEDVRSISPREDITFTLSRPLDPGEGRIAVLLGHTDVSSLLTPQGASLTYSPRVVPLPSGETRVTVYLVDLANAWKQIGKFTLRVEVPKPPSPGGAAATTTAQNIAPSRGSTATQTKHTFDRATMVPSITIGMKSQAVESHFPDSNRPPRPTFADLTLQGSVQSDLSRGTFAWQSQFNVVGSSFQQEALRFGTLRDEAPNIDLASYLMQFQLGRTRISVGHIAFGSNRHLINNFSSRGISISTPVSKYVDVSLAAMNGTSTVGWGNFFGLSKTDHQFVTGTAGVELRPEHRGELRFEFSILDGRLQPISNFNQGSITDVERSRGIGLRMLGAAPSQRWRFEGGFARSRFTNPADSLLSQGFQIVSVREATRNAGYFDGTWNVLQNVRLSDTKRANVSLNYKFEQVDPLFKSVAAASIQPDRLQNEIDLVSTIGDLTLTVAHNRFHDNLGNIQSVLKSLSRRTTVIAGAPLSTLFSNPAKPAQWLPRVSFNFDQVHQFAASTPINGGFEFSPGSIPNQITTIQNISADWQVKQVRWGYRFNRSFQDNQQVGRELADFRTLANVWSLGLQAGPRLIINVDAGFDSAFNKEQKRTDHTFRIGPNLNWIISKNMTFNGFATTTRIGDVAGQSHNRTVELDLQWAYRFALDKGHNKKVQGQFFLRYANRYGFASDALFGFNSLTRLQSLNVGVNFTFF